MHPKIHLSNKNGFTLIEIMASLVIIGVLPWWGGIKTFVMKPMLINEITATVRRVLD